VARSLALCERVSAAYRASHVRYNGGGINFGSIAQGSKTLAQLSATMNLRGVADYVTLLDDDTLVPATWSAEELARKRGSATQRAGIVLITVGVCVCVCQFSLSWMQASSVWRTRCAPRAGTASCAAAAPVWKWP
jgi:hypothetical protein